MLAGEGGGRDLNAMHETGGAVEVDGAVRDGKGDAGGGAGDGAAVEE